MSGQNRPVQSSTPSPQVDFTLECCGSVFFVRGRTAFATEALRHLVVPDRQPFVATRFVGGQVSALRADGWSVR
jgi:hypothetical protein